MKKTFFEKKNGIQLFFDTNYSLEEIHDYFVNSVNK